MSRKKRKTRETNPNAKAEDARYRPKEGPGSVFVEEFVSAKTGGEKRLRNVGEHPLTLAYARGKIGDEQFAAGEEVRRLYELRSFSGRDSTVINVGNGGAQSMPFTQSQVDAIRRLDHFRDRLKTRDWIIVEKFCGEGWSMADSVRAATACHPSGVLLRLQEALEELVAARRAPRARTVPSSQ